MGFEFLHSLDPQETFNVKLTGARAAMPMRSIPLTGRPVDRRVRTVAFGNLLSIAPLLLARNTIVVSIHFCSGAVFQEVSCFLA